jgi:hypothetical protein
MKKVRLLVVLMMISLVPLVSLQAASHGNGDGNGKGNGNGNSNDPASQVATTLSSVPLPELPAKAASLVADAKNKDKESVAIAAVDFTASEHPSSISAVVAALVGALPGSAPLIASDAVKLLPDQAAAIGGAAIGAAPKLANQITDAINAIIGTPKDAGNPNPGDDHGNRPTIPPGQNKPGEDGDTKEGTIHGNRPTIPPGHVHDPKPGRDDEGRRHRYGSP